MPARRLASRSFPARSPAHAGALVLAAVLGLGARCSVVHPPDVCGAPATRVHEIQGAGLSSPLAGRAGVVVEGVVVGDFQGYPEGLGGFFLQEEDAHADADPGTSEGLFVFDGSAAVDVRTGDTVRVSGRVREFFGLTELGGIESVIRCEPGGRATPAGVELPVPSEAEWERWEGMAVRLDSGLTLTDHFAAGRFGEVVLAAGGRLPAPTQVAWPGREARARHADHARRRILLDDGSRLRDPTPPPYLETMHGLPLRLGDLGGPVEGVLDFAFGRYRIQPTRPVRFESTALRPTGPPDVAGALRVLAWNVGNHFNGDGRGGGFPTRGARSPLELERQRAKLVATLAAADAHLIALAELENNGVGPGSAARELADALARHVPAAPFAIVDPGPGALGSHAISVGLLYRPDLLEPVGVPAVLDALAHEDFDSTRNRPSLAQTFRHLASGEHLTLVVNHFKSKGSSCDAAGDPDTGDGQGRCNGTRLRGAAALAEWLATDPTHSGGAPVLIVGDLNAIPGRTR